MAERPTGDVTVRPMVAADVDEAQRVATAAFEGLWTSTGLPKPVPPPPEKARVRYEHPLATDPGGCWVAERGRQIAGAAIAIEREGLWGLSLLAVDPDHQSGGLGRELLARAAAYGDGARGRIILSSPDPRAVAGTSGSAWIWCRRRPPRACPTASRFPRPFGRAPRTTRA